MLRKIGLQNFKCWKELDVDLAPITLFFGSNSSGKTAILQALLMLKQTARGFDAGQHINFGDDRDYVKLGSYQDVVYGHDNDINFGVKLAWSTSGTIYFVAREFETKERNLKSVAFEVAWGLDQNIYIDKLEYQVASVEVPTECIRIWRGEDGKHRLTSSFADPNLEPEVIRAPKKCYVLPWTAAHGDNENNRISILNLNSVFERFIDKLAYIGPLRRRPERIYTWTGGKPDTIEPDGAKTIEALIASAREEDSLLLDVATILQRMNLVEAFNVKPVDQNNRLYEATVTIGGVESSLADVGFGVSQVLPVITMLLMAPMWSIVLLEQPELHLHPKAQSALADLLLYAAETRKLQLIVESHSEHIVRRLQRRVAEGEPNFAKPENIKMYYCESDPAGSTAAEVEIDRFGQIPIWPEKFLGDISGDIHNMARAAIQRRSQELASVGHRD